MQNIKLYISLWMFMGISVFAQNNTAKYQLAETYITAGQHDKALPLLEDIHAVEPQNYIVYDKLRAVYLNLKQFDNALAITEKQIQKFNTPSSIAEKGLIYFKMGRSEEAQTAFNQAIATAPNDQNTYRIVYYSLYQERLFEQSTSFLEQGRSSLGDSTLFRMELGYAYAFSGNHRAAIKEYLAQLKEAPAYIHAIKAQLSQVTQQQNAVQLFVEETEKAIRQAPMNKEFRELIAWLYLEKEDYTKALDANRAISRLNNDKGLALFLFAQTALNADYFEVAKLAYQSVIQAYPEEPLAANAREGLFDLLIKQAETAKENAKDAAGNPQATPFSTDALLAGQDFITHLPEHPSVMDVRFKLAKLYKEVFQDFTHAQTYYQAILAAYRGGNLADESQFALAEIDLMQGDLGKAKLAFTRLYERLRTGLVAERAQFELAKIDFYEGNITTAFTLLEAMDANTTTDISNDAIRLKVILRENKGPDSLSTALTQFGKAKLLERQFKSEEALTIFEQILKDAPDHKLADEVKFDKALLLKRMNKVQEALAGFMTLRTEHADSYLADQALFHIADTYENILKEPQQALLQYTAFLVQYPGSLLTAEVRARIRKLRGERS